MRVDIQKNPQPVYVIGSPVAYNYLKSPHPNLDTWIRLTTNYSEPELMFDESEPYLRFTREDDGQAGLYINGADLDLEGASYDLHLWIRTSYPEEDCTLGMRKDDSTSIGDNEIAATFTTDPEDGWVEYSGDVTLDAWETWGMLFQADDGQIGAFVDIKLGAIMPTGVEPFYGDSLSSIGEGDAYYWEDAANASFSVKAERDLDNEPGDVVMIENQTTWSITEDATALTPADSLGGATSLQFGIRADLHAPDTAPLHPFELAGATASLVDDSAGDVLVSGRIASPSGGVSVASVMSLSVLSKLNVVKSIPPFYGPLSEYFEMIFAGCGITRPVSYDAAVAHMIVPIRGYVDNVWAKVKEMCAVFGIDISDRGDGIHLRVPRVRTLDVENIKDQSWSLDDSRLAQSIEIYDYDSGYFEDALVYPPAIYDEDEGTTSPPGWTEDTPILTVDAGETAVYEVEIAGSLMSVEQPECVLEVGPEDGEEGSVYTVVGQGNPDGEGSIQTLDPEAWTSLGGSVTVEVGENHDTLVITIEAGDNDATLAPFAIAMPTIDNHYYSSLRIRGTGILDNKTKYVYETGLGPEDTTTEVGVTIDTPFVASLELCERVRDETLPFYSVPTLTLSGSLAKANLGLGDIAGSRFRASDGRMMRVSQAVSSSGGVSISAYADMGAADYLPG